MAKAEKTPLLTQLLAELKGTEKKSKSKKPTLIMEIDGEVIPVVMTRKQVKQELTKVACQAPEVRLFSLESEVAISIPMDFVAAKKEKKQKEGN